jgi:integrase
VAALRLAPLVFVRPGELRQAEWSEIDLDAADGPRWSIPAEKMKMRRDHIVPLSKQAVESITEIHSLTGQGRYLFPCNRTNGRCMSNMALNAALRRMGYEQGEMCAHGFRAMAFILLNALGWNSDLIERPLALYGPKNNQPSKKYFISGTTIGFSELSPQTRAAFLWPYNRSMPSRTRRNKPIPSNR